MTSAIYPTDEAADARKRVGDMELAYFVLGLLVGILLWRFTRKRKG